MIYPMAIINLCRTVKADAYADLILAAKGTDLGSKKQAIRLDTQCNCYPVIDEVLPNEAEQYIQMLQPAH